MLRRRSSLAPDDEWVQDRRTKSDYTRIKTNKFKMSPFPEAVAPCTKQLDLSDVKISLAFEEVSTTADSPRKIQERSISPRPSINLRPSSMLEIQRHLTPQATRQQPRQKEMSPINSTTAVNVVREEPDEKQPPSAVIRSMWDNVVSWMKMAVNFVASDNPAEAEPVNTTLSPCQRRAHKRQYSEECGEGPSQKMAKLSFGKKTTDAQPKYKHGKKRRNLFRPPQKSNFRSSDAGLGQILALELESVPKVCSSNHPSALIAQQGTMSFKSPTTILAQNLSGSLAIQSPQDAQTCTSFFGSTKKFHLTHDGLNSILDATPNSCFGVVAGMKRIRRPALREFYGSSVNSPNLDEGLRRSPRLAERSRVPRSKENATTEESDAKIPLPPPPPPIPAAPLTPHIPPPPPTPRLPDLLAPDGGEGVAPEVNNQRDLLQKMQHRLRTRMKKKGSVQTPHVHPKSNMTVKLDIKLKQWAEIQARSRKITPEEFLSFAEQKKIEIQNTLESLQSETPNSMEAVIHVVELLQEACQWFPGGSKEMKDQLPLYKMLERKLETLNEYVQISSEMKEAKNQQISHSGIHNLLVHVREEFDVKHRHWGTIILTKAESWTKLGLPICHGLIEKSRQYLCSLVVRFVTLTLEEAANITGILVSIKSIRASQAKQKLKDSLNLLLDAKAYFGSSINGECASDLEILESDASQQPLQNDYSRQLVLSLAVDVSLAYIRISLEQFEGAVYQETRQEVCEHFECVLKILNLLKTLASKVSDEETVRNSGVINSLPNADSLGSTVYSSCVKLIQHIASKAQIHVSQKDSKEGSNREVVLWMMFGCKYVNCTLEVLGSEEADERGVQMLLTDLQQMETLLPD